MSELVEKINSLKKGSVRKTVESRLREFNENRMDPSKIFSELCFCICTANNSAERGLRAQAEIDFCGLSEPQLRKKMREVVCRFYNHKTDYIIEARLRKEEFVAKIDSFDSGSEAREWIVKNIKGLGYKEASHFLRNIGFTDVAIIDFHIIDILVENKLIKRPNSLTKKFYLNVESSLRKLAAKTKTNLAELDLYLWYLETGKILK
jgi:N-glycosylase/DNA lyase